MYVLPLLPPAARPTECQTQLERYLSEKVLSQGTLLRLATVSFAHWNPGQHPVDRMSSHAVQVRFTNLVLLDRE